MKFFILCILMITNVSIAADIKVSKEDFLKKLDSGRVSFDIIPAARELAIGTLMNISSLDSSKKAEVSGHPIVRDVEKQLIELYKTTYQFFDPEMMNIRYSDYAGYRYSVAFDFADTRKCLIILDRIDKKCGNPICDESIKTNPAEHPNVRVRVDQIPDEYCEKVYHIKIKKQATVNNIE